MEHEIADDIDEKSALERTARKTFGSWAFVGLQVLGAAFIYFSGRDVASGQPLADSPLLPAAGALVGAVVAAALSYRVMLGRGWIAGGVLTVWYVVEIGFKLAGGTLNFGWAIFHAACIYNLANGVLACYKLRRTP